MRYFKLLGAVILSCCIFCTIKLDCLAVQLNYAPLETLPAGADEKDYIALGVNRESYEVKPGDTLWGISGKFLGTGTRYEEIMRENQDSISDIYRLMPGDVLTISSHLYVPKDRYDRGGLVSQGGFHIASPDMVEHSYFLDYDVDVDGIWSSDISVYSLPVTNRMGENALTASQEDWEAFVAEVIRCSETCDGRVSDLKFEKYTMEDGCDLCGYSFDFDMGDEIKEYVMFCRLGKRNMAEVIGKRGRKPGEAKDTRLLDVTRYIAASFEDFGGRIGMGRTKFGDYIGAYDWNYPELHNLFTSAMKACGVHAEKPDANYPGDYEIVWTEPMFEQAVRNALIELWQLDEEEKEKFLERPLMASDMAVITSVDCTLYEPGHRYADDPEAAGGPVLILSCNEHSEKIYPGKKDGFSYEDLKHFTGAKKFAVSGCNLSDYSFLSNMTQLRELNLASETTVEDISFLAALKQLRELRLLGGSYVEGAKAGFLKITDLSVLKNCKELRYLYLSTPQVTDFSFLSECPELCTMYLFGEVSGKEPVIPDLSLLPKAKFLNFYGEDYRFEP